MVDGWDKMDENKDVLKMDGFMEWIGKNGRENRK